MALRRAHPAAIAAASDGSVLINVVSLLPARLQEQLGKQLGADELLFIGIALNRKDAERVIHRLDNAAAEASAHVLGRANRQVEPAVATPKALKARRRSKKAQR